MSEKQPLFLGKDDDQEEPQAPDEQEGRTSGSTAPKPEPKVDAITGLSLEKKYIEFETDSGEILYYNTSSLIRAAKISGEWKQPPDFRSPMSETLKKELAAKEGVADVSRLDIRPHNPPPNDIADIPIPSREIIVQNMNRLRDERLAIRARQQQRFEAAQDQLTQAQKQLYYASRVFSGCVAPFNYETPVTSEIITRAVSLLDDESWIDEVFALGLLHDLQIREELESALTSGRLLDLFDIFEWNLTVTHDSLFRRLLPLVRGVEDPSSVNNAAVQAEIELQKAALASQATPGEATQERLQEAQHAARAAANEAVLAEIARREQVREERKARAKQLLRERHQREVEAFHRQQQQQ